MPRAVKAVTAVLGLIAVLGLAIDTFNVPSYYKSVSQFSALVGRAQFFEGLLAILIILVILIISGLPTCNSTK